MLQYAEDQAAFFADYAVSHAKLSELGAEWEVRAAAVTALPLEAAAEVIHQPHHP